MAKVSYPSAKQDQFVLRFPDGLRDRVRKAAEANSRSMNSEIISTLEKAYPSAAQQAQAAILELYDAIDRAPEHLRGELRKKLEGLTEGIFG